MHQPAMNYVAILASPYSKVHQPAMISVAILSMSGYSNNAAGNVDSSNVKYPSIPSDDLQAMIRYWEQELWVYLQ